MITPSFDVTQDSQTLQVKIKINSIRFSAEHLEISINENIFIFHLSPYYLRLRFQQNLIDDERAVAKFVPGEECVLVTVPKATEGEVFEDLDLHSKLLARIGENDSSKKTGPLIQEIDGTNDEVKSVGVIGERFDWEIEQKQDTGETGLFGFKYGFDDRYDSIIGVSISNGNDINELDDPEHTDSNGRIKEREYKENLKFDPDYYLSEYMIDKYGEGEDLEINGINNLMKYVPQLAKDYLKWYKHAENKDEIMPIEFNETEQNQMQNNIPRKEYLFVNTENVKLSYISILNLLFSYIFENIENEGARSTESAWTIGKLTPQISFLDQQLKQEVNGEALLLSQDEKSQKKELSLIKSAIMVGVKRSLSYPLHRNYELAMKCWKYVYYLLRGGKRLIIKALLDIHEIFRFHDVYYVYNKVLLDDLVAWFIQQGDETVIRSLAIELKKETDNLMKTEIEFECIAGLDMETGAPTTENMTLAEMELIAETEYTHQQQE
ncbi:hypothetical protein KAFR_0J01460 [Kazachstania africana CBS 2517]|uniref:CS domain-containing protein n=1 Tax=Kazachstania africana (strain ATCC 22294 / BCRC 22015 / CBS 2517 / CECT 1963 / NBRC 1671 / NRRL Y-8276) TaxID=1071382 RepID=H2B0R2_KAZAF|nr:hypothetical protein KAFR_0J01460 [Kazachstania africana CBS 2517]CCF60212.1 hypothetical protein KAFR_0J01460 [Kazachstania africana CBS 2517]